MYVFSFFICVCYFEIINLMVSQKGNICCVLKIDNIVVLYPTTLNLTRNTCLLIIVVLGQLARALTVRSDTLLPPTITGTR